MNLEVPVGKHSNKKHRNAQMFSQSQWNWILLVLFIFSISSYPIYEVEVRGWPINFLFAVGICVLQIIIYCLFIKVKLDRED